MFSFSYNNITDCKADCEKVITIQKLYRCSKTLLFGNFQLVQLVQEGKNVQSPVFQLVQLVQEPGGNLASIHSMAENDFLEGFVRNRPVIDSRGGER